MAVRNEGVQYLFSAKNSLTEQVAFPKHLVWQIISYIEALERDNISLRRSNEPVKQEPSQTELLQKFQAELSDLRQRVDNLERFGTPVYGACQ